jgi:predicted ATPase/DNA-binding SARP family transcriptional activator
MLSIRTLGNLSVSVDGAPVSVAATRKTIALLVYLACAGVAHSREHLAEFLWEEQTQERSLGNLRLALARLDPQLRPYLVITRQSLALSHALIECDAVTLGHWTTVERAARGAGRRLRDTETAALEAALSCYRGDFLQGFYVKDSVAFEEWAAGERERLRSAATAALAGLTSDASRDGDHLRSQRLAAQLLEIDPAHEDGHRQLMVALALSGDRSGALAQFARCRRALERELDVEPDPETVALYQRIRGGELGDWRNAPERSTANTSARGALLRAPSALPRPLTAFVGRKQELDGLISLLSQPPEDPSSPPPGLITLHGPGGCGKTRLALEVARRATDSFPDGAVMLDLAAVADPLLFPPALAAALGLPEQPGVSTAQMLLASLEGRRQLILLDNCEAFGSAAGQFALHLLLAGPQLRVLATSQTPLGVPGEVLWQVKPLDVLGCPFGKITGAVAASEALLSCDAVRLFVERAQAASHGFTLTQTNASAIARICQRLDGLPLAIELAAARVRLLSPQQIADRLDDAFRLLPAIDPVTSRHDSLAAAMAWSWGLLRSNEQVLLRRLAVFRGDFSLDAAEAVCADTGLVGAGILNALGALVDRSLVLPAPDRGVASTRYRLLELVRQYAMAELEATGEAATLRRRHLAYCCARAEALEPELQGPKQAESEKTLEADDDNYRAALSWGLQAGSPDLEAGLRLAAALAEYWQRADRFGEGSEWCERAVLLLRDASEGLAARVFAAAGTMAWLRGDYARATELHAASLERAQRGNDRTAEALALHNLGVIACYRDQLAGAREWLKQSMRAYEALGDARGIASVLIDQSFLAALQADYQAARKLGERSLPVWQRLEDHYYLALVLHNLGDIARLQGDLEGAAVYLAESMALCRAQGNRRLLMMSLTTLGRLALKQGDASAAAIYLRDSLVLSRALGDRRWLAENVEALGQVAAVRGDFMRAARLLAASSAIFAGIDTILWLPDLPEHLAARRAAEAGLGAERFAAEWTAGSVMDLERILALAVEEDSDSQLG